MASEPERTEEVREFSASTKILRDLLRRVRGISESDIETICEFHEECPELYESNPWALTNLLSAYGIKAPKVNFIVQQYLTALYGTPIASNVPWGGWNPGGTTMESLHVSGAVGGPITQIQVNPRRRK